MAFIATFDAGTTALKGVLVGPGGRIAAAHSVEIPTLLEGEHKEQNPGDWWSAFCTVARTVTAQVSAKDIAGVVMSGQMQDLIMLDEALRSVGNAILYSDGRAEEQARRLEATVGAETCLAITGNHMDGSLPLPKLMWLRECQPEVYAKTHHILISSKDYLIARLTGACCGDVTACSTAGAMDIRRKCWDDGLLAAAGVSRELFPRLLASHQQAGAVLEEAAPVCGFLPGTPVYAGVGDAGATTLASGIAKPGQFNINLGTSGWVAGVSDDVLHTDGGVFNLAAMPDGRYINVVPFLNAGNVHQWIARLLTDSFGEAGRADYKAFSALLRSGVPGSGGVFFLPYLNGERFPVLDAEVRGSFFGMTAATTAADLAHACLEGVAYSIRQGLEQLTDSPQSISLIGGGGRETVWCQILADVLGREISVFRNADILPSLAVASAVLLGTAEIERYEQFTDSLQTSENRVLYQPDAERTRIYGELYRRYRSIYPLVRTFYHA